MSAPSGVSFAELRNATPSERRRLIAGIAERANAPANGRLDNLRDEIGKYEDSYGISSEKLLDELYYSERRETSDILHWLMLIRLRERLESGRS